MNTENTEHPMMGHNLRADIKQRSDDMEAIGKRWVDERPVIEDEEMAGKARDFLAQLGKLKTAAKAAHGDEKKPHLEAGREVDTYYKGIQAVVTRLHSMINPLLTTWLQKLEAERQAKLKAEQEEAERIAQEAEAAKEKAEKEGGYDNAVAAEEAEEAAEEAQETVAKTEKETTSVAGDLASRASSLRTFYSAKVVDHAAALHYFKDDPRVVEAVQTCANGIAREQKENLSVPGLELVTKQKAV